MGQWARVTLDEAAPATPPLDVDVLDLDAALTRLAAFNPRKSQLAELRFFGGLSLAEAGEASGFPWRPPSATGRRRGRGC